MVTRSTVYQDHTRSNGKEVKNLGWLLRNWKNVKEFRVYTQNLTNPADDAILTAEMRDGRIYETGFADKIILNRFLRRPVFYALVVVWDGERRLITK